MFDPWEIVESDPRIRVEMREFEECSGKTNGLDLIFLDPRLLQVEQRCTLTHELVHISRGHYRCQPLSMEREVRRATSRLLVSIKDLRREMRWARHYMELADELAVTPRVLSDRLECLTPAEMRFLGAMDLEAVAA